MDAVEYLKTIKRMCELHKPMCWGKDNHTPCELRIKADAKGMRCGDYAATFSEEAVAIVEKWAKEHPRKTRQSEFLKQHPNASIERGVLELCPALVDLTIPCKPTELSCWECRKINWLAPIEEATNKEIN